MPPGRRLAGVTIPHPTALQHWVALKATKRDAASSRLQPCLVTQQLQDTRWPRASPAAPCRTRTPRGTAASHNLRCTAVGTGCGEPTPAPSILLCQDTPGDICHGTSVMGHPSGHTATVSPPRLCPNGTLQCEPPRPCRHPGHTSLGMTMHPWALSRVPGHCHPSLGTAVCPWGCSQHCSGHGGGSDRTPLLSPRIPRQGPRCVSPGGSVPGPQPGHHIPATAVTERLCPNVTQLSGCPGLVPLPWGQDPQPNREQEQGWGGSGAAPDSQHGRRGCPSPPHSAPRPRASLTGCQRRAPTHPAPLGGARKDLRWGGTRGSLQSGQALPVGLDRSGGRQGRQCRVPSPSPGRVPRATGDESAASLPSPRQPLCCAEGTGAEHGTLVPPGIHSPRPCVPTPPGAPTQGPHAGPRLRAPPATGTAPRHPAWTPRWGAHPAWTPCLGPIQAPHRGRRQSSSSPSVTRNGAG